MATGEGPERSENRDPAGADRVTSLERRSRRLLTVYPALYRRERGEEIIGTLLEASDDRTWPRPRDVRALAVGGLKARAAQNRQRTTSANLRVAVMAGLAMYLSLWVAAELDGVVQAFVPNSVHPADWTSWPAAVTALLVGATVVFAWTAPRVVVMAGATAASAAVVSFGLAIAGPPAPLGTRLVEVLGLMGLAALAPRSGRPPRRWLLLPGAIVVASPLLELGVGYGWLGYSFEYLMPGALLFVIVVAGILWVGIDARLLVAVVTYFALSGLQATVTMISSGFEVLSRLPFLLVVVAIAAPAIWLLRRQSARPVR
jgi:hypothetical protein